MNPALFNKTWADCFYWVSFSQPLSAIDQTNFIASFFDCEEAFLGQESEWFRKAHGCSIAIKSRNFRAFSGAHWFCIILADKLDCSDTDEYFLWDRSKIRMRCSSILLRRHGNLWGSTAFMVIDFVCLLFIKLFVAKSSDMWLRPQAVLRMFLFWFLGDVCLWFWCWAFLIFLSVGCGWDNSIENQVWGSLSGIDVLWWRV